MMSFAAARPILAGLALAVALLPSQESDLGDLLWLEGEWQRETRAGTALERWARAGSGLAGEGVTLRGDESVHTESLLLVEMGDSLLFVAWPVQNPYPVAFPLVSRENGGFVFENTTHDFPQRITYSRTADDALTVTIEGPGEDGEPQQVEFHFVRR